MTHQHRWGGWFASFIRLGFLGNTRRCLDCAVVERRFLGGYDDERKDRIVVRLNAALDRNGRRFA